MPRSILSAGNVADYAEAATGGHGLSLTIQGTIAGISIGVHEPAEAGEMLTRTIAIAIRAVAVECSRWFNTRPSARSTA
jgi:Ethanolamine utilization protein EutJ (predicted chaperonin)